MVCAENSSRGPVWSTNARSAGWQMVLLICHCWLAREVSSNRNPPLLIVPSLNNTNAPRRPHPGHFFFLLLPDHQKATHPQHLDEEWNRSMPILFIHVGHPFKLHAMVHGNTTSTSKVRDAKASALQFLS